MLCTTETNLAHDTVLEMHVQQCIGSVYFLAPYPGLPPRFFRSHENLRGRPVFEARYLCCVV